MSSPTRWMLVAAALLAALGAGCYRSHGRERSVDAGSPGTPEDGASVTDGGAAVFEHDTCPVGYHAISSALVRAAGYPRETEGVPGLGSLAVQGRSGELFRDGHGGDHRFDLCVSEDEYPLDLTFLQQWGPNIILDVTSDFEGATWGRGGHLVPSRRDRIHGTLVRSEPESRFLVHLTTNVLEWIEESPFDVACTGILGPCRIRFVEVGADGSLLGAGAIDAHPGRPEPIALDASGSSLASSSFEVVLPDEGLLARLPLTEVRPLDCRGPPGPARPGELDLWRCTIAGIGNVRAIEDGVARGTVDFVTGPDVIADTLVARLGAEDDDIVAHVLLPCCTAADHARLSFPGPVLTLEAPRSVPSEFWFYVEAGGFDHAFAWIQRGTGKFSIFDHATDGVHRMVSLPQRVVDYMDDERGRLETVWLGAITTEPGRPPWAAGRVSAMVRRRIAH